jgi:hypothetical protein
MGAMTVAISAPERSWHAVAIRDAGMILIVVILGFGPAFATQLRSCQRSATGTNTVSCLTSASSAVVIGLVLYLASVLAALLAWIVGLFRTAQLTRWGWFVVVLLISPLGSLLYGVASPATRATA